MCNLYSMTRNREAILRLFRVPHDRAVAVDPLPAIFAGYQAPVVVKSGDDERELIMMNRRGSADTCEFGQRLGAFIRAKR